MRKAKYYLKDFMFRKLFTPQEANRRLPLIKNIVTDILEKGRALKQLLSQVKGQEVPLQCVQLQGEMEVLMHELEELGCFYKDWNFEIGLVDFPAIVNGEEVLLCWRSDEKELQYYHSLDEGFSGRKSIPQELFLPHHT